MSSERSPRMGAPALLPAPPRRSLDLLLPPVLGVSATHGALRDWRGTVARGGAFGAWALGSTLHLEGALLGGVPHPLWAVASPWWLCPPSASPSGAHKAPDVQASQHRQHGDKVSKEQRRGAGSGGHAHSPGTGPAVADAAPPAPPPASPGRADVGSGRGSPLGA